MERKAKGVDEGDGDDGRVKMMEGLISKQAVEEKQ